MIISIGLIDDSYFALCLYKEFFQNFRDVNVIFAVSSLAEISKVSLPSGQHPDIILLDIVLKEERGIDYIPVLKQRYPATKIIMLTACDSEDDLLESLRAGASGYVVKENNLFELYTALKKVSDNGAFICSKAAEKIIGTIQKRHDVTLAEVLSKREMEMIDYIKQGLSYKEIAQSLYITTFTVNHHMKKIYKKLQVSSKSELISKLWSKEI
jgi:DNA-binding NarL/FixJ family response regulator